jgi:hypothetical protein
VESMLLTWMSYKKQERLTLESAWIHHSALVESMLIMWMSYKKQELFTLRERLDTPRCLGGVHVAHVDVLLETRTVYNWLVSYKTST